ncbi:A24 family peptidase [Komagataeibacter sp. FNDCR2]|uniref:prepilin peptidase n=1 Tax=Komagataeibacter sp. FNDCR2 TaxID=2878682 RepID=UPI001E51136D|nr:A24 family peptidase [Komagataeibacter sp. FNDCR2]MCE2574228.1 A24 family peptidase [Komagataeibacter sp. FNDCR2]
MMDEMLLLPLLVAPFMGSFAGVLIMRLPQRRPVLHGRSACDSCNVTLGPHELLPLLSYGMQRGRCRTCQAPIGFFHTAVELGALMVAVAVIGLRGHTPLPPDMTRLWAGCILGWTLLALGWIDLRTLRLPDALTLPLVPGGLLVCELVEPAALVDHALAAVMGYAGFRLVAWAYRSLRGYDGLGQGDAKLLAAAGAWIGSAQLPVLVAGAAIVTLLAAGVTYLIAPSAAGAARTLRIPFGPGLGVVLWVLYLLDSGPWAPS